MKAECLKQGNDSFIIQRAANLASRRNVFSFHQYSKRSVYTGIALSGGEGVDLGSGGKFEWYMK
jgi:hypothetical protein